MGFGALSGTGTSSDLSDGAKASMLLQWKHSLTLMSVLSCLPMAYLFSNCLQVPKRLPSCGVIVFVYGGRLLC